jgi:putative OmpL-like beta-barrel porin-2
MPFSTFLRSAISTIRFRARANCGSSTSPPTKLRSATRARATSFLQQAFASAIVPLARERELELDAGRFGTPVGLEDNESLPNWNYGRSLLFSWAEPTLHTGLRATCLLTPRLAASAFWVNGWNSVVVDGNGMRTFAGAVTVQASDAVAF